MALLPLTLILLAGLGPIACGGTSPPTRTKVTTAKARAIDSNDPDGNDPYSTDDYVVLDYGHPASPSLKLAIVQLVKRYYAAAAGDGTNVCSLLVSKVAEIVPGKYGHAPGPPYPRNKTCDLITKLFKQYRHELATKLATLQITRVRIEEEQGLVVLHFAKAYELRQIAIQHEGHAWKISQLFDTGMT